LLLLLLVVVVVVVPSDPVDPQLSMRSCQCGSCPSFFFRQVLLGKMTKMALVCWIFSFSQDFQMTKPCKNGSKPMLYRYTTFLGSEHPLATEAAQALQTDGQSGA